MNEEHAKPETPEGAQTEKIELGDLEAEGKAKGGLRAELDGVQNQMGLQRAVHFDPPGYAGT